MTDKDIFAEELFDAPFDELNLWQQNYIENMIC